MNILYYSKDTDIYELIDIGEMLTKKFGEGNIILLPDSTRLMTEVSAECLFAILDQICLALDVVKKERPQEYADAMNLRWAETMKQKIKENAEREERRRKKKKNLCDTCTVPRPCPDDNGEPKEKCVWYSHNPGGI